MIRILPAVLLAACSTVPQPVDPATRLVEARLDLARSLLEARAAGNTCDAGAYREDIITNLTASVTAAPAVRDIIAADPAFEPLHGDLDYRMLIHGIPRFPVAIQEQLTGVTVHGPTMGAYGSTENLTFESGGVVRLRQLDGEDLTWGEQTGDWWVEQLEVVVRMDDGGLTRLTVQPDATLWLGDGPEWFAGVFECDV